MKLLFEKSALTFIFAFVFQTSATPLIKKRAFTVNLSKHLYKLGPAQTIIFDNVVYNPDGVSVNRQECRFSEHIENTCIIVDVKTLETQF